MQLSQRLILCPVQWRSQTNQLAAQNAAFKLASTLSAANSTADNRHCYIHNRSPCRCFSSSPLRSCQYGPYWCSRHVVKCSQTVLPRCDAGYPNLRLVSEACSWVADESAAVLHLTAKHAAYSLGGSAFWWLACACASADRYSCWLKHPPSQAS